jgi:hypothetical protein
MVVNIILFTVLLPGLIALGIGLATWTPWNQDSRERPYWAIGLAMVAGYLVLHVYIYGFPSLAPSNDAHWLFSVALLAGLIGVAEHWLGHHWSIWVARVLAVRISLWLSVGYMFESHWNGQTAVYWLDGITIGAVLWMALFDFLVERAKGIVIPASFIAIGLTASGLLGLAGTAKVAQLIAALTAASGAWIIPAIWSEDITFERTASTVFVILFTTLLASGYFGLFEQPVWGFGAFSLMPIGFLIYLSDSLRGLSRWKQLVAQVAVLGVLGGTSVFLAQNPPELGKEKEEESSETTEYPY